MQKNNPDNFYQENEINLRELLNILSDSKIIIIAITLICTVIAAGYAYTKKPVYEANAQVIIGHYYYYYTNSEGVRVRDTYNLLDLKNLKSACNMCLKVI